MLSGAACQLCGSAFTWQFSPGWREKLGSRDVLELSYMKRLFAAHRWYDLAAGPGTHDGDCGLWAILRTRPHFDGQLCGGCSQPRRNAGHGLYALGPSDLGA
jgi:hypothetical protein